MDARFADVLCLIIATTAGAQVEMSFANKVLFTKTGDMDGVRLAVLLPAPVTNEYQEISALHSNCGKFYTISENKKVLYYAGTFDGPTLPIVETFVYKSKPVIIDFSQKTLRMLFLVQNRMNILIAMVSISI